VFLNPHNQLCISGYGNGTDSTSIALKNVNFFNTSYLLTEDKKQMLFTAPCGIESGCELLNGSVDTEIPILSNDIYNTMDHLGAMVNLERHPGEKNASYFKRLKFFGNNQPNSTKKGLVNGIMAELGVLPTYRFYNVASTPVSYIYPYKQPGNILVRDKFIQNFTNVVNLANSSMFRGLNHFIIDNSVLRYNYSVYEVTIYDFAEVQDVAELTPGSKTFYLNRFFDEFSFTYKCEVKLSDELGTENTVSIKALNMPVYKYCPVSASSIYEEPLQEQLDKAYVFGESNHPNKWS